MAPSSKLMVSTSGVQKMKMVRPFQERTNAGANVDPFLLSPRSVSAGFDRSPASSQIITIPSPAPETPIPPQSRRLKRYSAAEQALASSFQQIAASEPSPYELQARALEQAIALLSTRARDAQEHADRLRTALADRNVDRKTYEGLLRERWREERRRVSIEEEAKVISEQLRALRRPAQQREIGEAKPQPKADEARKKANLAKFFAHSVTRTTISAPGPRTSAAFADRAARRVTMNDAEPMRLRTTLARPVKTHARSISLDAPHQKRTGAVRNSRGSMRPLALVHPRTPLSAVAELPTPTKSVCTPTTASGSSTGTETSACSTPPPYRVRASAAAVPAADSEDPFLGDGRATIFMPARSRSKADLLANLWGREQVEIPEYAKTLLDAFGKDSLQANNALLLTPPRSRPAALPDPDLPPPVPEKTQLPPLPPSTPASSPLKPRALVENQQAIEKKPSRRNLFSLPEALSSRVRTPQSSPSRPHTRAAPRDTSPSKPRDTSPSKRRDGSPVKSFFSRSRAADPPLPPPPLHNASSTDVYLSPSRADSRHSSETSLSGHLTLKLPSRVTRRFSNFLRA